MEASSPNNPTSRCKTLFIISLYFNIECVNVYIYLMYVLIIIDDININIIRNSMLK